MVVPSTSLRRAVGAAHLISILSRSVASYLCHCMLTCAHYDGASSRRRSGEEEQGKCWATLLSAIG